MLALGMMWKAKGYYKGGLRGLRRATGSLGKALPIGMRWVNIQKNRHKFTTILQAVDGVAELGFQAKQFCSGNLVNRYERSASSIGY